MTGTPYNPSNNALLMFETLKGIMYQNQQAIRCESKAIERMAAGDDDRASKWFGFQAEWHRRAIENERILERRGVDVCVADYQVWSDPDYVQMGFFRASNLV